MQSFPARDPQSQGSGIPHSRLSIQSPGNADLLCLLLFRFVITRPVTYRLKITSATGVTAMNDQTNWWAINTKENKLVSEIYMCQHESRRRGNHIGRADGKEHRFAILGLSLGISCVTGTQARLICQDKEHRASGNILCMR